MTISQSRVPAYYRGDVPYNSHRQRLAAKPCEFCGVVFLSPLSNRGRFCDPKCRAAHVVKVGQFKGDKNPRWLGGVSDDNMRYRRRQRDKHPEREAARKAVASAVRAGKLIRQPCEVCQAAPAESHHDDYSKPLVVRWLCPTHHDEHHANKRRLARIKRVEGKRP